MSEKETESKAKKTEPEKEEPTLKDDLLGILEEFLEDELDSAIIIKINRIKDIAATL
jgi:hypothetical protein